MLLTSEHEMALFPCGWGLCALRVAESEAALQGVCRL